MRLLECFTNRTDEVLEHYKQGIAAGDVLSGLRYAYCLERNGEELPRAEAIWNAIINTSRNDVARLLALSARINVLEEGTNLRRRFEREFEILRDDIKKRNTLSALWWSDQPASVNPH